jgi:uncharacterized protein (TIGR01777 family)
VNVLLTGGTGLVGSAVLQALVERGDSCRVLTRDAERARPRLPSGVRAFGWSPLESIAPAAAFEGVDAVVNLAGEPVNGRWSGRKREAIRASRVVGTTNLVAGIAARSSRPAKLISVSAVGYYGDRGDEVLSEESPPGSGFIASTCVEWERAAMRAEELGVTTTVTRLAIVLGRGGGALPPLLRVTRLGLGGPLGSGRQWWPWVHLSDVARALVHAIDDGRGGVINVAAPAPVRQRELAAALGRAVRRPALVPAPTFALKLVLGGFESELLTSRRAVPVRLLETMNTFRCPELDEALRELVA